MNRNPGKTALVLAGGGLTGAFYEIGALRAIDDLLVDRTINDFDIYIGTSAGALVSTFIANGVSPERMFEVLDGSDEKIKSITRNEIFSLNRIDYLKSGIRFPGKIVKAWSHYLRNWSDMTMFDLLWSLSEVLPSGFYDSDKLTEYVESVFDKLNLSNDFKSLNRKLYIIATDLDTGHRAIFSSDHINTPISKAIAASSAMPIFYKPVCIQENEYIDGGLRGIASIDLAIEKGAKLVVCINPLVPFDNASREMIPFLGPDGGHLSQKGFPSIANQTIRILTHSGLHYHIKQLRRSHPDVDIILIEPNPDDYQMFFYNIMRYSTRLIVSRHGFESVTYDLAVDYPVYKEVLSRHKIPISRRLVIEELEEIENSDHNPDVILKIIEAKAPRCGRSRRGTPVCELTKSLAKLEMKLDEIQNT